LVKEYPYTLNFAAISKIIAYNNNIGKLANKIENGSISAAG